jgi:O-methyltransferase involved in polyketide biosynthesis
MTDGLGEVSRTALWTVYCRAAHAERGLLHDPEAIRIRDALGLRFGRAADTFARRAAIFDRVLQAYLDAHPGAAVVSLGEGLETQLHRVRGYGRWTSVDLPPMLALRERFLAPDATHRHLAASATDLTWLDALGDGPAFVVAQGLLFYLEEREAEAIVAAVAARRRVGLMFDVVPPWLVAFSKLKPPVAASLRIPRMRWGVDAATLPGRVAGWTGRAVDVAIHPLRMPAGPFPGSFRTVGASMVL